MSGPFRQPEQLKGSLSIQQFSVEIDRIPLKSDGPVELSFANQVVTVRSCTLVSDDNRFTLTGTAGMKEPRHLNLHANGNVDLKLAQTLDPDLTSYGLSKINLAIAGTATDPLITGEVEVEHAGLSMIDMPVSLGDVTGKLVFNQDRLSVEKLTGHRPCGQ